MQQVVKGVIIAFAVIYDIKSKNKRESKKLGSITDKTKDKTLVKTKGSSV